MKNSPILLSLITLTISALCSLPTHAANFKISLGIREVNGTGPAFANGGASGGIEWVNLDGQNLAIDGTWQKFTFTPTTDTLTLFAGATANGTLDTDWVTLEHIRILNSDGITTPVILRLDDIANTTSTGSVIQSFETSTTGTEVIFQEPTFSGSTSSSLVPAASSSLVTESAAFTGVKSNEIKFQFVNATPTNWIRLTSNATPTGLNPFMLARQTGFAPTISFYAQAFLVPEPTTAILGLLSLGLLGTQRRRK